MPHLDESVYWKGFPWARRRTARVIILTAFRQSYDKACSGVRCQCYILKPFDLEILANRAVGHNQVGM